MLYIQNYKIITQKRQNYHATVLHEYIYFFDQMVAKSIFTLAFPDVSFNQIAKHNVFLIRHRVLMNLRNSLWKGTNKTDKSHIFIVFKESIPTNNNNFISTNPKQDKNQQDFKEIRKAVHSKLKSYC